MWRLGVGTSAADALVDEAPRGEEWSSRPRQFLAATHKPLYLGRIGMYSRRFMTAGLVVAAGLSLAVTYGGAVVSADHAWGSYHWARTGTPFTLTVVNSTTSKWSGYVPAAVDDWSASLVLDLDDTNGSTSSKVRRRCKPPAGMIRVCNLAYGNNGWLGLAGISIDPEGHILNGYTKLNDSYFSGAFYDDPLWRQSVVCQELGHDIGLDHQDENFNNDSLETCMDYQNPPWDSPNAHDYDQLDTIYGHLDSYNSYAGTDGDAEDGGVCNAPPGKGCNKPSVGQGNAQRDWGISLGRRGASETFLRIDPDGTRHLTFVTWVDDRSTGNPR
jgi:hypothetical protein